MDPNIETEGLAKRENFQDQPVPSYPDNGKFVGSNNAAFFDGPVSLWAVVESEIELIPEGMRKEAQTLIEAHTIAEGGPPADITEVSGYEALTRTLTLATNALLPFRVCMVLTAPADSVMAVY